MRLYIAGSDKVYAIENFYVKYLRQLGVEVFHFPSQSIFYDYYQKRLTNKLIFKAGFSSILNKIKNEFKKTVEDFSPDIIWVFKGMELEPESLIWAKKKNILLVNFNGDSPFVFSGSGSGNAFVKKSISLYDLHLTYSLWIQQKIERDFKIPASILPFGFDIDEALHQKCCYEAEVEKVCFVGNPDRYRGKFIQQLAENGVALDVYGNNWEKFVKHHNVCCFAAVYGEELWLVLRRYRVQLNLMRPHNPDSHNMRTFEVPGVGGIQLAPSTIDHKTFFEPGKEIFIFEGIDNCKKQIERILTFSLEEANVIRETARKRSLLSGYTYKARALQVLELFNNFLIKLED